MASPPSPHFAIFPFLAEGHIIPLLHLSRLLHRRSANVTIFTTASNSPPIRAALLNTDVSIVELPFPQNIDGVPQGAENTKSLPSMSSCFIPFVTSLKLMQKSFEDAMESLTPPVSCVISDGFLGFTFQSAQKLGVPRLVFFGMGAFSCSMYEVLRRQKPHAATDSPDEPFPISGLPGLELTKNDFDPPFNEVEPSGPYADFMAEQIIAMAMSHGIIVNTFYQMEQRYVDHWDKIIGPKSYCIGPLCAAAQPPSAVEKPYYVRFLDEKLAERKPVLYVAFGTQAEVWPEQVREISEGLERSEVSFLWVLKPEKMENFTDGFQEKVKTRGIVVGEWVDQLEILKHEGVKGFLSHCGWNSVVESITAGVPILALPFMADQQLNARLIVELGVGMRIMPSCGSVRGLVAAAEVEKMVRELMCGEDGAEARRKMAECGGAARDAMKEGGSSLQTLDLLIDEMSVGKEQPLSSIQTLQN